MSALYCQLVVSKAIRRQINRRGTIDRRLENWMVHREQMTYHRAPRLGPWVGTDCWIRGANFSILDEPLMGGGPGHVLGGEMVCCGQYFSTVCTECSVGYIQHTLCVSCGWVGGN